MFNNYFYVHALWCFYIPGFLHFTLITTASVVGDVSKRTIDGREIWFADI